MRTPHTVLKTKKLRAMTVLLIAVALVVISAVPLAVAAKATTTLLNEYLSDMEVRNGVARIVYSTVGPMDLNLSAFTFNVPGSASDQIEDLIALVESFGLPRGPENSLITKLDGALAALESGDTATACSSLTSFINESSAQSGKKLTADQANQLIEAANQIKTDLGCE